MGTTKSEIFTAQQNKIALIAKAIGHPARVAILESLLKTNSCVCGDLVEEIGLAQATISQHLRELKKVGIIKGDVEGTMVCYCINESNWKEIEDVFNDFFGRRAVNTISCC